MEYFGNRKYFAVSILYHTQIMRYIMNRIMKFVKDVLKITLIMLVFLGVILLSIGLFSNNDNHKNNHLSETVNQKVTSIVNDIFEEKKVVYNTLEDVFVAIQNAESEERMSELDLIFAEKISQYPFDSLLTVIHHFDSTKYFYQVLDSIKIRTQHEGLIAFSKVYKSDIDKEWADSLFAETISRSSLDSLLADIHYFDSTKYFNQVLDSIEVRALNDGMLAISKVYQSNIDTAWADVVDCDIIEVLDDIPVTEHKELIPYYIGTDYETEICESYIYKIDKTLNDMRAELSESLGNDVDSLFEEPLRNDIADIYEEFLGGFLGYKNITNNVIRKEKTRNKKFTDIWYNKVIQKKYDQKYSDIVKKRGGKYLHDRKAYLRQLTLSAPKSYHFKRVLLKPNFEVMRYAVDKKQNRAFKDAAFAGVGIATWSLTGWLLCGSIVGETALDLGLDNLEMFKDPEEFFIENQKQYAKNQYAVHIAGMIRDFQKEDSLILNDARTW